MRNRPLALALAGAALSTLLTASWGAPPGAAAPSPVNCDTTAADVTAAEQQMLVLVNAERSSRGMKALKLSPSLARAAAWKSADPSAVGSNLSHTDSLGRGTLVRFKDCAYPGGAWGEIIAYVSTNPQVTLDAWMASSGHRGQILTAGYVTAGVGQNGRAWTMTFSNADDSGAPPGVLPPGTAASPTQTPTRTPSPLLASTTVTVAPPTATPTPTPTRVPAVTAQRAGVQMQLAPGFNLVTYGGPAAPAADAFASLGPAAMWAYMWDPAAATWRRYVPGGPAYINTFTTMVPGQAYFVALSAGATWTY